MAVLILQQGGLLFFPHVWAVLQPGSSSTQTSTAAAPPAEPRSARTRRSLPGAERPVGLTEATPSHENALTWVPPIGQIRPSGFGGHVACSIFLYGQGRELSTILVYEFGAIPGLGKMTNRLARPERRPDRLAAVPGKQPKKDPLPSARRAAGTDRLPLTGGSRPPGSRRPYGSEGVAGIGFLQTDPGGWQRSLPVQIPGQS